MPNGTEHHDNNGLIKSKWMAEEEIDQQRRMNSSLER